MNTTKSATLSIVLLGLISAIQSAGPNIASTALVGASRGLQMVGGVQALAASTQTLAIAASVISTGLIADRIGRRKVLIAALVVGGAGNLIVLTAPTALFYILGQAVTGVGLGAAYAAAFAFIGVVAPPEKLAGAMGTFAASGGLFTVLLTFAGGSLASADWRLAFLLLPVMAALAVLAVFVVLPVVVPEPQPRRGVIAQVLLALGLVSLLYGISQLASSLTSPQTLLPIAAGLLLLTLFVISQRGGDRRVFPVELFRKPLFLAAIAAGFVYNFSNAVAFLQVTNLWQYILGLKTSEVSVWQLPLLASGIIGALVFGRLMSKGMTARVALTVGTLMTATGFICLYLARGATDFLAFLPGSLLLGAGFVIASLPYGTLILSQAPKEFFGPVTSSRTTFGQLFYSIGLAASTVVIDQLTRGGVVARLTEAGVPADQVGTGLDAVTAFAASGTRPQTSLGQQALSDASGSYVEAFGTMMLIAAAVTIVVGLTGSRLLRRA